MPDQIKNKSSVKLLDTRLIFSIFTIFLYLQASTVLANQCVNLFSKTEVESQNDTFEWKNDKGYIQALQKSESLGVVQTFHSKEWDTQVYFTGMGKPNSKGESPLVDPAAEAVYVFFHGSGTQKSSGKNFVANMNTLAKLGFSAVSFDMPFHANGSKNKKMNDSNYFMEWARKIILEVKKSGKPVILAGHSFGPDVIFELITRYPYLADGVVGLSPASFNKELSKWYDEKTSKMNFGGAVSENIDGGQWAYSVSKQFLWSKNKLADPSVVNKNLKIRILSGNREEYVPAPVGGVNGTPIGDNTYDISVPLLAAFKNAKVTVEPGIGHYLFDHLDETGTNVVFRELILGSNLPLNKVKAREDEVRVEVKNHVASEQIIFKYAQDKIFKVWIDNLFGKDKFLTSGVRQSDSMSKKIMEQYLVAQSERDNEIHLKILNTKNTHPEFYEKYKKIIDSMTPNKTETSLFVPYFKVVLEKE